MLRFRPNAMTIARAGRRPFSGNTNDGLFIIGGETLTAPNTTYLKIKIRVKGKAHNSEKAEHTRSM